MADPTEIACQLGISCKTVYNVNAGEWRGRSDRVARDVGRGEVINGPRGGPSEVIAVSRKGHGLPKSHVGGPPQVT
ncbi:Hypothetical protein FKW44_003041 [Caligus rogercresseyi]|uniref:Uncharacterized protein n=1 Tax=Caligus rogercresseyi TaxID=217165 RepID=A0A7T8QWR6_CALRO|nr:Hypothetical protein FKW44_003041 [Caligus rogercresseyi]